MIFVDTGAFFALLDRTSRDHAAVVGALKGIGDERQITTNAVIHETHALVVNRLRDGARIALQFVKAVELSCEVLMVGRGEEEQARAILEQYSDKGFSFCDALSFAVMDIMGVTRALSLDRHFQQYGNGKFAILPTP